MTNFHFKPIILNDHDVLSGRGVNISSHPGNERFRSLLKIFRDNEYCKSYSVGEKRAVAKEVMTHIRHLDPPGRFLKLESNLSRGKDWRVLSESEAMKKICQALRDCNRQDRSGYANKVITPTDVVTKATKISSMGLTIKQRASATASKETEKNMFMKYFDRHMAKYAAFPSTRTSSKKPIHGDSDQHLQRTYPNTSIVPSSSVDKLKHEDSIPAIACSPSKEVSCNDNQLFQSIPSSINNTIDYTLLFEGVEYIDRCETLGTNCNGTCETLPWEPTAKPAVKLCWWVDMKPENHCEELGDDIWCRVH